LQDDKREGEGRARKGCRTRQGRGKLQEAECRWLHVRKQKLETKEEEREINLYPATPKTENQQPWEVGRGSWGGVGREATGRGRSRG